MQGDAAPPLADGRYRLISVLGVGGMATVYRGFDTRLQVHRAVKVLSPALARRRSLKSRFEAEASMTALLEHRNIVSVHDVGADGNRVYIVMELVEGGSLLDRVREQGPIPPKMAMSVMIRMLDALKVAHQRGIVHRDIKPHNILITHDGDVRITDFGIAQMRRWEQGDGLTKTGAVMGTWGFMAPEQRQDAKAVDHRADLYSAGATLYSILTDKTPVDLFAADLDASMMLDIEPAVASVLKMATRYNREERYESADQMADACREVIEQLDDDPAGTPPLALPPPNYDELASGPSAPDEFDGLREPTQPERSDSMSAPSVDDSDPFGPDEPLSSDFDELVLPETPGGGTLVPPSLRGERSVSDSLPSLRGLDLPSSQSPGDTHFSDAQVGAFEVDDPFDHEVALPAPPPAVPERDSDPFGQVVVPPVADERKVSPEFWVTSALAGLALVAVILLLMIRPWQAAPLVQTPVVDGPNLVTAVGPDGPEVAGAKDAAQDDSAAEPEGGVEAEGGAEPEGDAEPEGGAEPAGRAEPAGGAKPAGGAEPAGRADPEPQGSGGTSSSVALTSPEGSGEPEQGAQETEAVAVAPTGIRHSSPRSAQVGRDLSFSARLDSPDYNLMLFYRAAGQSSAYDQRVMQPSGGNYLSVVPVDGRYQGGLEYFIKGTHRGGGPPLAVGSAFKPLRVSVSGS